jgi:hypothetical protein
VGELDRIHSIAVTLLRRKRIERAPSPISRTVTQEGRL